MDKPNREKLTDAEKEIIELHKSLISEEHKFEVRVFFTIVSLSISILGLLYGEVVDGYHFKFLLLSAFVLLFIFSIKETVTYSDLRKEYANLISVVKNDAIFDIKIKKRGCWKKFIFAIESFLYLSIILLILYNDLNSVLIKSLIAAILLFVIFYYRLEY